MRCRPSNQINAGVYTCLDFNTQENKADLSLNLHNLPSTERQAGMGINQFAHKIPLIHPVLSAHVFNADPNPAPLNCREVRPACG